MSLKMIALSLMCSAPLAAMAAPYKAYIPEDKGLDPAWVASLDQKGEEKVYQGDELRLIAMPCGGIGGGQVEITGDGRLCFTESVYNQRQQPNGGHGVSTGYQYLNPKPSETKIPNGFSIKVGDADLLKLNGTDFDDMRFVGQYPMAKLDYRSKTAALPVQIRSEVFSPFVPLSVRDSANPVTMLRFTVKNTSKKPVDIELGGWLDNVCHSKKDRQRVNKVFKGSNLSGVQLAMTGTGTKDDAAFGNMALCVLDQKAVASAQVPDAPVIAEHSFAADQKGAGSVTSTFSLAPNEDRTVTFLITWYFPNLHEIPSRYKVIAKESPGWVGHIYNNWYGSSIDVAQWIADHADRLYAQTDLFRATYRDTTMPNWLADRLSMPLSTLVAGNISVWESGRMYAYEGVGFCPGTCGHVYNFVATVAKLFPELERSVRIQQDFNSTGPLGAYSSCGRINFRGYGVNKPKMANSYASDAQSGYVLKAYREHLMSPDNAFLDSVWEQVKGAIGYQIFKDGAEIGLPPNGVLEGKQTFWDPMWYGPNPYNNTLYLAALRAAEEMALVQKEPELAQRYRALYESGRKYMEEEMWTGENFAHLYPNGFLPDKEPKNGFNSPATIDRNAESYIKSFNAGKPNYYVSTACDAQQLFGQNWAHQLGLGYILAPEMCKTAAGSVFKYNYTPDIKLVYDLYPPKYRTLAAYGEAALVNGAWPKVKRQSFENIHDKDDIWSGLECDAACNMITEGHLTEALIVLKSIHERYDAKKRNPWNEVEGSDHYSRAMQAWNVLRSLSGCTVNGPAGKIGFAPNMTPENYKSFFSAAEGWGSITQKRDPNRQINTIELRHGSLRINSFSTELPEGKTLASFQLKADGKMLKAEVKQHGNRVVFTLGNTVELQSGTTLEVVSNW